METQNESVILDLNSSGSGQEMNKSGQDFSLSTTKTVQEERKKLKIVVVGDGTVGKTCMCIAYTQGIFPDIEYVPTVFENYAGAEEYQGTSYDFALWDTAGQEDYERLRPLSYPETNVFLLCFSIANITSFQNITTKWYPEIRQHSPKSKYILIGTKCDLRPIEASSSTPWYQSICCKPRSSQDNSSQKETYITPQMGNKLAAKLKAFSYVECSAKDLTGIKEVMLEAVKAGVEADCKKSKCSII